MHVELTPGVKSRPQYPPLSLAPARAYGLFIAPAGQESALQSVYDQCAYAGKRLLTLAAGEAGLQQLQQTLSTLTEQSTGFVLAGSEAFMWDVANALKTAGFVQQQIQMLPPLDNSRRLFCTHCYTVMENVQQSPVVCSGCGRHLLVRDHFSRLHGAYVGVQINAEDSADIPAVQELS